MQTKTLTNHVQSLIRALQSLSWLIHAHVPWQTHTKIGQEILARGPQLQLIAHADHLVQDPLGCSGSMGGQQLIKPQKGKALDRHQFSFSPLEVSH